MTKVFVIIVTYKGQRWYDQCFGSLRKSTLPVQLVVVDNSPGDEDAEYIKTHFPEVHLIKTNENLGFGRANNLGMRYAMDNGCDYVFLLNQDAWLESPTSLERLISIAETYPDYAIYSPMHMTADKQHLNFMIDDGKRNYELLSDLYTNKVKELYPITYVNAAAWLLPRRTLETIGGFCPIIYHYGEDDDYMSRVRYHKARMALIPSSRIVHDHSKRLDNSQELFVLSNTEEIESWLDLNSRSLREWKWYYIHRLISCALTNNKKLHYYWYKYSLLKSKEKEIQKCRNQHMVKQANWL